jgi:hypothetical protein
MAAILKHSGVSMAICSVRFYQVAEKFDSRCPAPKGASDSEELAVSLKRYPDTKPEFFRKLFFALQFASFVLFALMLAGAQAKSDRQTPDPQNKDQQSPAAPGADYSGMYSFLRDGEFVQVTVEDHGNVIGFVSRYADKEGDSGFVDHFLKSGKLDGSQLAFATETVHGVSFEFRGTVERGEGKSRGDEAYYVLRGTLVENTTDEAKKTSSRTQEVGLKSFPQDLALGAEKRGAK